MQRFLKWLGMKLFPPKPEPKLRTTGIRPKPKPAPLRRKKTRPRPAPIAEPDEVELDTDLQGRIEDGGPGKNILVRNKYVREETGTYDTLKIIDDSLVDTGEEAGFDPYNTGRFDRAKNWNSRNRK